MTLLTGGLLGGLWLLQMIAKNWHTSNSHHGLQYGSRLANFLEWDSVAVGLHRGKARHRGRSRWPYYWRSYRILGGAAGGRDRRRSAGRCSRGRASTPVVCVSRSFPVAGASARRRRLPFGACHLMLGEASVMNAIIINQGRRQYMWNKKREEEPLRPSYTPPAPPANPVSVHNPVEVRKETSTVSSMPPADLRPNLVEVRPPLGRPSK